MLLQYPAEELVDPPSDSVELGVGSGDGAQPPQCRKRVGYLEPPQQHRPVVYHGPVPRRRPPLLRLLPRRGVVRRGVGVLVQHLAQIHLTPRPPAAGARRRDALHHPADLLVAQGPQGEHALEAQEVHHGQLLGLAPALAVGGERDVPGAVGDLHRRFRGRAGGDSEVVGLE